MICGTVITNSLSYLANGKAAILDGSPAKLVLRTTTKPNNEIIKFIKKQATLSCFKQQQRKVLQHQEFSLFE